MARPTRHSESHTTRGELVADATALTAFLAPRLIPTHGPNPRPSAAAAFPGLVVPPRDAGVLLPLYARAGQPYLLFTRRAPTLSSHSGEISFPGGSRDPADPTLIHTALREADEELRITPASVSVLGLLEPVFTVVSNFLITPVVGWLGEGPISLQPNPAEVAEVIEAPLAALADPAIFHLELWTRAGRQVPVYFYDLGPHRIWGATGRIVHHLLSLLPDD